VSSPQSHEKEFRRLFRTALDSEVTPALSRIGFETKGIGGYSLQWNDHVELATNIRESKWNKFGAEQFEVLFSIWMMEAPKRWVRGIWLPVPRRWTFGSPEEIETVGSRLLDGVLLSALSLAADRWGAPTSAEVAAVAAETPLEVARDSGDWHIPGEEA